MVKLEGLTPGASIRGILPDGQVIVVSAQSYGSEALELTYKAADGKVGSVLLYRDDEPRLELVEAGRPWSFDGDGALFRLVSEAQRIHLATLTEGDNRPAADIRLEVHSERWSSQVSVDTSPPRLVSRLELVGAHSAKVAVTAYRIVEGLDVVGYVRDRELVGLVDVLFDAFFLQATEEGFSHRVVPAVPLAAHARFEVVRAAEAPPRIASILSTLIRVNQRAAWSSATDGHRDGVQHQLSMDRRACRPADDLA